MNAYIVGAVVLAALAFLAHQWTYTTTVHHRARRRNLQLLLIAALLAVAVLCAIAGVS